VLLKIDRSGCGCLVAQWFHVLLLSSCLTETLPFAEGLSIEFKQRKIDQSGHSSALGLSQMMVRPVPFTFSICSHGYYQFFEDGGAAVVISGGDEAEGMRRRGEMCQLSTERCQLACTVCLE